MHGTPGEPAGVFNCKPGKFLNTVHARVFRNPRARLHTLSPGRVFPVYHQIDEIY